MEQDDVLQAARLVVVEESPDLDFDHLAVTALKWTWGILNYHSARALLDMGDAITDAHIAPFLPQPSFILLILNSCVQVLSGSAFVAPTADTIVNYIPHSKALVLYLN